MHTPSEAQWMHYYASLVLLAAMPQGQRPQPGLDASEQEIFTWLRDHDEGCSYDDPHLSITRFHASDPAYGEGFEIVVMPRDYSGDLWDSVLVSYQAWDDPEPLAQVKVFEPGPWCAHLVTLAHRAATVLQGRPGAEAEDFYVHHDNGRDA
jgi:hypothetical protein